MYYSKSEPQKLNKTKVKKQTCQCIEKAMKQAAIVRHSSVKSKSSATSVAMLFAVSLVIFMFDNFIRSALNFSFVRRPNSIVPSSPPAPSDAVRRRRPRRFGTMTDYEIARMTMYLSRRLIELRNASVSRNKLEIERVKSSMFEIIGEARYSEYAEILAGLNSSKTNIIRSYARSKPDELLISLDYIRDRGRRAFRQHPGCGLDEVRPFTHDGLPVQMIDEAPIESEDDADPDLRAKRPGPPPPGGGGRGRT